jgi:hypothetical protein
MPELETVEKPKVAGFVERGSNYERRRQRMDQEEEEIQKLEAAQKGNTEEQPKEEASQEKEADTEAKEETLSAEEKSFKKRYGDLRRHMSDKEKEWQEKLDSLEQRLTKSNVVPPKSDEDIEAWSRKHPDVAGIVETIAAKKAKEMFSNAEQRLQKMDEQAEEMARNKAEDSIREAHSDFDKLRDSDDFHDWADRQPKWVKDALYENMDDPESVIRVIDLYKIDNNMTKSDYAAKRKAAASNVGKGSKTQIDANDSANTIRESDVAKMSTKEFEKNEEAITKAMRSGKFIYDISGSAR